MILLALSACLRSLEPADTASEETAMEDTSSDDTPVDDTPEDTAPPPMPDPNLVGPYTVSTRAVSVPTDLGAVSVQLAVPSGAGPWPWVLLLPGFQLGPTNYAGTAQRLASHGFLVASPELPFGSFLGFYSHTQLADASEDVIDALRVGSEPLVDDALLLAGHSLGGKLALMLASRGVAHQGVFAIDPVDAGDPSVVPQRMAQLTQPLVLLGETTNGSGGLFGQNCAPLAENFQAAYEAASVPVAELDLLGANHMSFLDNPNCGLTCSACPAGTDDPATTLAITRRAFVAFAQHTLGGHPEARAWLVGAGVQADVDGGRLALRTKNGF